MKYRMVLGALAIAGLALGGALADTALKSGPQVGSRKIPPFNPLHCNGPDSDTKICLV
jgi:hypothetical protein